MVSTLQMKIIDILSDDARIPADQIAVMLGESEETVKEAIADLIAQRILVKYSAVINWERPDREMVQAFIEVNVQPQREHGFDAIAASIQKYDEVKSLYLMSGAYDLMVMVEAPTLKQLASFVSSKLSTLEAVTATATHFMLKTYKQGGVVFSGGKKDTTLAVSP